LLIVLGDEAAQPLSNMLANYKQIIQMFLNYFKKVTPTSYDTEDAHFG